jgi:hypothetical protein
MQVNVCVPVHVSMCVYLRRRARGGWSGIASERDRESERVRYGKNEMEQSGSNRAHVREKDGERGRAGGREREL